jgi:hypothetical protein
MGKRSFAATGDNSRCSGRRSSCLSRPHFTPLAIAVLVTQRARPAQEAIFRPYHERIAVALD